MPAIGASTAHKIEGEKEKSETKRFFNKTLTKFGSCGLHGLLIVMLQEAVKKEISESENSDTRSD